MKKKKRFSAQITPLHADSDVDEDVYDNDNDVDDTTAILVEDKLSLAVPLLSYFIRST